jgi:outer membrane protein insertion porin family
MNKIFILLIFLILSFSSIKAEIIKKIEINGNKRVSDETVKIYGDVKVNKDYSEKDLDSIIKNLYSTNFFEDISIDINNSILRINLVEYPTINQLIIVGENSNKYKKQIKEIIQLKEKRSFIRSYLAKDIDIIKQLYSSLGYNSSSVETKIKKIDDDNYDLLIEVERGEQTKISSINFIGNNYIRDKRLRDIIASEENKFWKVLSRNVNLSKNLLNLDKRLLINYYKSLGFYDIEITSNEAQLLNKGKNVELTYSIIEGERYTINKISTNIDKVFDKSLFFPLNKAYKKYVGEYYSPFKIQKLLEDLDELIEKNNLQFVEHNVEEIVEGNTISIKFNVYEGEKVLVERINVTGNSITNEDVIRGELILDEGDPFTNLNLEKSISEIKSRNLFKDVTYEVLNGSENNLKIINIAVKEKPTGEISAGAGIGTNGGSFAIGVKENNWLGQGKNVGLELEIDQESLAGTLSFVDPNYDFLGNSLNYSVSSETNDKPDQGYENSVIGAEVGTSFEQYKDVITSFGLSANYDDLKTTGSASDALKKQSGSFSEVAFNYGFSVDKRNRAFMPTDGSIISFGQSIPIYADKSFISNAFSASKYKTISEDIIGSGKFFIAAVNGLGSDDVRLSKRKYISSKRLRGFERNRVGPVDGTDHVGGNYVSALNFEANLPNFLPEDTKTDVGLFLDFANVWGVDYDSTLDDSNKIRSSTGIVANFMSPIGPLSFTFSQNLSKASTDKTESFNFNLGTTF